MTNPRPVTILAISGSLRARSSNTAVLAAAARLTPSGVAVAVYRNLAGLPHFNPDLEQDPPASVLDLRNLVGTHDALLFSSPEYARGIAGSLKNALDWLVGALEFPDKPVAVLNASPRATHADTPLRLILTTMSARLIEAASITLPLLGRGLDADGIVADPKLSAQIRDAMLDLVAAVNAR